MKILLAFSLAFCASAAAAQTSKTSGPLAAGSAAPGAARVTVNGNAVPLKLLLAGNPNVLVLVPGGCASCDGQLQAIQAATAELSKQGVTVFALSPDTSADLAKTADRLGLTYKLFSDPKMQASRQFGVVSQVADAAGGSRWQLSFSAFLIGRDGSVRAAYSGLDKTPLSSGALVDAAAKTLAR